MSELVEKMIAYRAKHSISQKELAKRCHLSEITILNAERGKRLTNLTIGKIKLVVDGDEENDTD